MAVRGGKKVLPIAGGLRLRSVSALKDSVLFFDAVNTAPTTTSGIFSLYVSGTSLIFDSGSGTTTIGAAGAGGTPTWETIFAADATFTMTPDNTFTIAGNRATATDVVTITNIAGGSGSCLQITNSGTGNDIDGTSNTWGVTALGAATFLTLTLSGTTITSTAADVAWALEDNDATALSIGAAGETDMMVFDTRTGVETVTFNNNLNMTGGNATFVSTSNTVTNVLVTNNTITTFGANASSAGAVCLRSTSLTTGALLQLQLSDTANVGGFYLSCRESIGGTNDFTIGENGVVTMAGTASTTSFTMSLGNLVLSDGTIAVTTTGTADVFSITANSILTNNAVIVQGSGTFTGTTTGSFVYIAPTGLTTGTALNITANTANTTVGLIDVSATGLTSGSVMRMTVDTATFTTGGKMIELDSVAAVAGNHLTATTTGAYTGTGMILVTAGAATTGILVSLVSTTGMTSGSLLRGTTSTAGAVATNGVFSFRGTGAHTSTSNTGILDVRSSGMVGTAANSTLVNFMSTAAAQVDTTLLNVEASGFTTGYTGTMVRIVNPTTTGAGTIISVAGNGITSGGTVMTLSATALTTGVGLSITASGGTAAITSGSLLRVATDGTGAIITNGIVSLTHTGIFTSTSATDGGFVEIKANSTIAGTIINVLGTGITTGIGMHISNGTAATTTGSLLRVTAGGVGAVATNGVVSFVHTGIYTSSTVGFLNVSASGTTGGTVATFTGAAVTDGVGLQISNASITTGRHFSILGAAGATMFSVLVNGATTIAGSAIGTAALTLTNGDATLSSGNLILTAGHIKNTPQAIVNANTAISIVELGTTIANNGASTHTLANGTVGQLKYIVCTVYTADAVITPANFVGTTITLNAAGDSWLGVFVGTEWVTLALGGTAAVA